jgi:multiple sugar transport system permease protein
MSNTSVEPNNVNVDVAPKRRKATRESTMGGGWKVAIWFLAPSLIGFLLFYLVPTIRAIAISFQDFDLLQNKGKWIGTANYTKLFHDKIFWNAVVVTLKYVAMNMVAQTIFAVILAVLMDRLAKSIVVRGLVLVPWVLPNIVVGLLWLFILDPNVGILNKFLTTFFIDKPIIFVRSSTWVLPTMAFVNTWKYTGYTALLLYAGMQVIPKSLYEAAALDGASESRMLRNITMPLLRPVLALVLVVNVIGSFQVFDIVAGMSGGLGGQPGGPLNKSRVIYLYVYENAFLFRKFGYAASIACVMMVFLVAVTLVQFKLLRADKSDLA